MRMDLKKNSEISAGLICHIQKHIHCGGKNIENIIYKLKLGMTYSLQGLMKSLGINKIQRQTESRIVHFLSYISEIEKDIVNFFIIQ